MSLMTTLPAPMTAPVAFSNSGKMRAAVALQIMARALATGWPLPSRSDSSR